MIIECPACRARFRLDEAKIKGKGARVRCRRCGESIVVLKPHETTAPSAGEAGSGTLDLRSAVRESLAGPPSSAPSSPVAPMPPGISTIVGSHPPAQEAVEEVSQASSPPATEEISPFAASVEAAAPPGADEVDTAFEKFLVSGPPKEEPFQGGGKGRAALGEGLTVDFPPEEKMDFSLGTSDEHPFNLSRQKATAGVVPPGEGPLREAGAEKPPTSDFLISDEDSLLFLREEHDKDTLRDGLDISVNLQQAPHDSAAPQETPVASPPEEFPTRAPEPLLPGSSAENALPPQHPTETPEERKPVRPSFPEPKKTASPVLRPSLVGLVLLFVALAGGGAYLGFTKNGQELVRGVVPGMESLWLQGKGKTGPQYDVRNLIGYYEPGMKAGSLFIIKGQVTNAGRARKTAIRVQATLLDNNDLPIAEKTCYAGNVITGETMRAASREQIDEMLSNRFGEKLINMDVAPGKSVPFMVVFFNTPEGISAYRLEAKDGE